MIRRRCEVPEQDLELNRTKLWIVSISFAVLIGDESPVTNIVAGHNMRAL